MNRPGVIPDSPRKHDRLGRRLVCSCGINVACVQDGAGAISARWVGLLAREWSA